MKPEIQIETITQDVAGTLLGQRVNAPLAYTPSILVPVPRIENRQQYNITNDDFIGYDTWNCYEISFMLDNGMPLTYFGKLVYPSTTPNIVESKSLKLYLNSFNMESMGVSREEAEAKFVATIKQDLSKLLECTISEIKFTLFMSIDVENAKNPINMQDMYHDAISMIDFESIDCKGAYQENPDILVPLESAKKIKEIAVYVDNVRSNCRVTHQPDWNTTYIYLSGENVPTVESLVKYLISFRNESHFHEECCEMVYKRLKEKFSPDELGVTMLYTRRGGISITPQRASETHMINGNLINPAVLCLKTIFE